MGLKRSAGSRRSFWMVKHHFRIWLSLDICNWAKTCFLPITCSVFNIFQKFQNIKWSTTQKTSFHSLFICHTTIIGQLWALEKLTRKKLKNAVSANQLSWALGPIPKWSLPIGGMKKIFHFGQLHFEGESVSTLARGHFFLITTENVADRDFCTFSANFGFFEEKMEV